MTHMIVWHNNGNPIFTADDCGYSEEWTDRTKEEVCAAYEASGCTVFHIDIVG